VTEKKWFWSAVVVGALVALAVLPAVVLRQDNGSSTSPTTSTTATAAR